jgi:hypothetical protein
MMWPWKLLKKDEIFIEPVKTTYASTLSIVTKEGKLSFTCSEMKDNGYVEPWRDFMKWYYCRQQSATYSVHFRSGLTMVRRDAITSFSIKGEKE